MLYTFFFPFFLLPTLFVLPYIIPLHLHSFYALFSFYLYVLYDPSPSLLFCNLFFLISLHVLHDSFNFNLIFPPSPTIYPTRPSLPPVSSCPFLARVSPPPSSSTFFPTITAHRRHPPPLSPIRYAHTARVTSRGQHVGEFKHLSLLLFLESPVFAARRNGKYRWSKSHPPLSPSSRAPFTLVHFRPFSEGRGQDLFSPHFASLQRSAPARTSRALTHPTRLDEILHRGQPRCLHASARPPTSRIDFPPRDGKFERQRIPTANMGPRFLGSKLVGSVNFVLSFF